MSLTSEKFNLPPNVAGRARGFLDVVIERVTWKTSKSFSDVKIRLLWWGQREAVLCEGIKIDNKRKIPSEPLRTIRYQVNTNERLFQSYLKHCEPIKLEIYSTKTQDFIGSCDIEIPQKFQNSSESEQSCRTTLEILSNRNFNLGEIVVGMHTQPTEKMSQKSSVPSKQSIKEIPKKSTLGKKSAECNVLKENYSNKENIQVIGQKKRISFRLPKPDKPSTLIKDAPKPVKTSKPAQIRKKIVEPPMEVVHPTSDEETSTKSSDKTSLMNFLSGVPMSRADEINALHDLANTSPSASIIEGLNKVDRKSSVHQPKLAQQSKPSNKLADKIDSIRISISQVELNAAGQMEAQRFMSKNRLQKFVVKCAITSKCFKTNEDARIISPVFETAPSKIAFNKEITQRISTNRAAINLFINFGFCIKPIDQQTSPFFIGFSRVDLAEVINSRGAFHKKCPIINESDMRIGSVTVKMELGINELHFGRQLIDSLFCNRENISVCSEDLTPRPYPPARLTSPLRLTQPARLSPPIRLIHQHVQTKSHPSHSNDQCESDRNYENKNVQTDKVSTESRSTNISRDAMEDKDAEMLDVGKTKLPVKSKVYRGLLFIESLRNVKDQSPVEYFVTYEGFWNECQESTEVSVNSVFNYLKQFPVICDDSFLKRVQNNHLELKLWEKTERSEKWIGSTKLPLHQFFIAFRDVAMIEHLSSNQLPIISIDTWANFISPLSNELFCQAKVLLAIGNENQIEYLKLLRSLNNLQRPVQRAVQRPVQQATVQAEQPAQDSNVQIKNKLTAFIESLSQKLPEPGVIPNPNKSNSLVSSTSSGLTQPQLRKTSELLESLQKALSKPPPAVPMDHQQHQSITSESSMSSVTQERVRMIVTIDHASHLPKVVKKKQNRRKSKNQLTPQKTEFEPSAYATFESCLETSFGDDVIKSHEGFVHCTKVIKGCDPQWNQVFNVELPVDVITNSQKRFVVKIWRKVSQDAEPKAAPFEDAVIGFSAIDLSVLLTGLPILSGYYNVMDFSGRCNGQIRLSIKPLDDLLQYQDSSASLPVPTMAPLSVDIGSDDSSSTLLSRTLKRKFTELDEITQRLKARLFDVTGDENFDPDEEFERDLNTAVEDMEDDDPRDFAWLKDSNGNAANDFQSQLNQILEPQPSTSKSFQDVATTQRQVSGCSNPQTDPMGIDQLLKKYDLDTLINPSIFRNLLDPTLANSDSTPTLNPQPINSDEVMSISGESGDTTVSSILSHDQVQTIQAALQKTSIGDSSDQSSARKDPDGEHNVSE